MGFYYPFLLALIANLLGGTNGLDNIGKRFGYI